MDESERLNRHRDASSDQAARANWSAALLELIPFAAIPLFLLAVAAESAAPFWAMWIPLLISGAGWFSIGRTGIACALALARALLIVSLVLAFFYFLFSMAFACPWEGASDDCTFARSDLVAAIVAFVCLGIVALLVPLVSAIIVAFASRERVVEYVDE